MDTRSAWETWRRQPLIYDLVFGDVPHNDVGRDKGRKEKPVRIAGQQATRRPQLSESVVACPASGIRVIANEAAFTPGAIRLDLGQPDFPTPAHICDAAKTAIAEGWTSYTHTQGLATLREAIAEKIARVNGYTVQTDEISCAGGGIGGVAAALAAVTEPGDEVLIPDPGWPNFQMMCAWTGGRPVYYPCPPELAFEPDLEHLETLVTSRTKVLIVNNPSNPTGAVFRRETVEALCDFAVRHNLWLLSDECYDEIVFEGEATSPATILSDGRVISAYTFSKSYSMTGWRIGYVTAAAPVIEQIAKVLESNTAGPSTVGQKAAEAALAGPQDCVRDMTASYRTRRDVVVHLLREAGLLLTVPRGAFYIMADVSPCGLSGSEFALQLLREEHVSVAPGTAFGQVSGRAVRVVLASAEQDLREGIARLVRFVHK
jgi:aspartate aminotransferase